MTQSDPKPRWWSELAWRLYRRLPWPVIDIPGQCIPYILPCYSLRVPVAILRGPAHPDGQSGIVVTAGAEPGVSYWVQRFFVGQPRRELVGQAPVWNLARTLQRLQATANLTIARIDRLSARFLFDGNYLAVPEWVGTTLTVPEQIDTLTESNYALKRELRKVRRHGLTSDITHVESDFEVFYHTMYVPFIRNRHGEHAVIRSIDWLRRIFHHGGLLWVRQNGQLVAGLLFQRRHQLLRLIVLGTLHG